MQQRTLKVYYIIHSWTGVICGLVLFIVCWSGTVALFHHELSTWENPELRIPYPHQAYSLDGLHRKAVAAGFVADEFFIFLPTPIEPTVRFLRSGAATDAAAALHFNPHTGAMVASGQSAIAEFLRRMHTDLHLPPPWGRYLVGLCGVFLMLSLVSGVIIHRTLLRAMFTLRLNRSWRLWLSDGHKQLGVWGMPFNVMMGFTGTVIGLVGLIAPVMALSAFQGDLEKAVGALVGEHVNAAGAAKPMHGLDEIVAQARHDHPHIRILDLHIMAYGDANARVVVGVEQQGHLASLENYSYSLTSGEFIAQATALGQGIWRRVFAAAYPLHYGTFAGIGLKLLYLILGVGLSVSTVLGILLWLERRQRAPRRSHDLLRRFSIGVCGGSVVATAVLFGANQVLPRALAARAWWEGSCYWAAWLIGIGYGLMQPDSRQATQHLCGSAGLLFLAAPILNSLMTEAHLLVALEQGLYAVAGVDIGLLAIGLLLVLFACRLPQRSPQPRRMMT